MASQRELAALNELLADRSYVANTRHATAEDIAKFEAIRTEPNAKQFPHVGRWYRHIASLRSTYASYYSWPSASTAAGSASTTNGAAPPAAKKGRAAGKERQQLEIDCKVLPVADCFVPSSNPPPLGCGATVLPAAASRNTYYITTAIHYSNGYPHIGHAYENLTADVFARYHRLLGEDVFFMTGNDEHGQKIAQTAEEKNMTPIALCDKHNLGFLSVNQRLLISNDFYMRTTSPSHKEAAQELWRRCKAKGDIYLGKYEGWYLVREERFITDQEAEEFNFKDPSSGKPLTKMSEPSFFFKLSKYQEPLIKYIQEHEDFIQPQQYRTEVLERLKSIEMRDLSISRGTFDWGVECPEDLVDGKKHVFYVWFDALTNYVSGVFGMDPKNPLSRFWPADMHVIGKDIVWFHTVYWPAMLWSAGLALPKSVVVHGFIAGSDGRKMSKSFGNVVDPNTELDRFACDTLRWYFCREAPYGDDLKFSVESLALMHNAELCDNLGNLVQRAVVLSGGAVPEYIEGLVPFPFDVAKLKASVKDAMAGFKLSEFAQLTIVACRTTNKWLADLEPWNLKTEEKQQIRTACLRLLVEAVYTLAHFFAPFTPTAASAIFQKFGTDPKPIGELSNTFQNLTTGQEVRKGSILFEQLDPSKFKMETPAAEAKEAAPAAEAPKAKAKGKADNKKKQANGPDEEDPDQPLFSKLDVRVGRVVKAWNHPDAERLFVEEIDVGEGQPRQIVSGLREHYTLEEFQGRKLLVVCNMKPSKLVKVESSGMVLCAKNPEAKVVELLTVPDGCNVGDRVLPEGVPATWAPMKPDTVKKKKVWESVAEGLRSDANRVACFEGTPLTTTGGVRFVAPTQPDAPIS